MAFESPQCLHSKDLKEIPDQPLTMDRARIVLTYCEIREAKRS